MITNTTQLSLKRNFQSNKMRSSALAVPSFLPEHVDLAEGIRHARRSKEKERRKSSECPMTATSELLFLDQKYQSLKQSLRLKKIQGVPISTQDLQEMGNLMNIIGMKYSQNNDNAKAEDWLKRALKYGEYDGTGNIKVITFNNLACVYKRAGDLGLAILYLTQAQKEADILVLSLEAEIGSIEQKSRDSSAEVQVLKVVTDCSLNLCAILSAMGEHYKALRAARKALSLLNQPNIPKSYYQNLFPIVKYNEAVELEQLRKYPEAEAAYLEAYRSPCLTQQLLQRLKRALGEVRVAQQKQSEKQSVIKRAKKTNRVRLSLPKFCMQQDVGQGQQFYSTVSTAEKKSGQAKCKMSIKVKTCKQNAGGGPQFDSIYTNDSQVKYRSATQSKAALAYSGAGLGSKSKRMTIENFYNLQSPGKGSSKSTAIVTALSTFRGADCRKKSVLQSLDNI